MFKPQPNSSSLVVLQIAIEYLLCRIFVSSSSAFSRVYHFLIAGLYCADGPAAVCLFSGAEITLDASEVRHQNWVQLNRDLYHTLRVCLVSFQTDYEIFVFHFNHLKTLYDIVYTKVFITIVKHRYISQL